MTNAYFHKLEDYKDIESIQYYTELTDAADGAGLHDEMSDAQKP